VIEADKEIETYVCFVHNLLTGAVEAELPQKA